MKGILETAGKSLWKEVRELALKKGTETLVSEGIKAVLEVVKRRRIRIDEYEFAEWKKEQKPEDEKSEKAEKPVKTDDQGDPKPSEEGDGEAAAKPDAPKPDAPADPDEPDPES